MTVPVINLADHDDSVATIDANSRSLNRDLAEVADEVHHALKVSGFFYIDGHGIDANVLNRVMTSTQDFFALPLGDKQAVAIDQHNRGYLGFGEARMRGATRHDLKEVFFFGRELEQNDPDLLAGRPLCALNRWPDKPPLFKKDVIAYLDQVRRTGEFLLQAIALSLGADQHFFAPFYQRPMARGQLIHYPAPAATTGTESNTDSINAAQVAETADEQFGVAEHTDFGCITLLHQGSPGLEVRNQQGDWMKVPPIENTLVVNIGDLLERWTRGRAPSTRHRVRNITGASRYSVAIFYDPSPTAIVDPDDLNGSPQFSADLPTTQLPTVSTTNQTQFAPIAAADYILQCSRGVFAQFK